MQDPFESIVGHEAAKRVLMHHLDRPLHGYLFVGLDVYARIRLQSNLCAH
jgi:hypothetical protein